MYVAGFHFTYVCEKVGFTFRWSEMEGVQKSTDHKLHSPLSRSTWSVGLSSCRFLFHRKIALGYICCWSHVTWVFGMFPVSIMTYLFLVSIKTYLLFCLKKNILVVSSFWYLINIDFITTFVLLMQKCHDDAAQRRMLSVYPHRMSRKGYANLKIEWVRNSEMT